MMYYPIRFLCQFILKVLYFYQVSGKENIPKKGKLMVCSNHISNIDPPLVGSACPRPIHFFAKAELLSNRFSNWFMRSIRAVPVKRGAGDRKALREAMQVLKDEKVFGIFPEGTRAKEGEENSANSAHRGAAVIALKMKSPIIPTAVIGPYRLFRPVKVIFGKPIDITPFTQEKMNDEIVLALTNLVMHEIQQLVDKHR